MITTRVLEEVGMRWTLGKIASATGGRLTHAEEAASPASGVSIDTRTLEPGDVYIAISGERHDGHAFLGAAFSAGAVAAIVEKGRIKVVNGHPLIEVSDTLGALQALASRSRASMRATVLAVTGSNGKTTTREMIATVLREEGATLTPSGNRNNHIGVPLTLLDLDDTHRYAVLELAMNHEGEISLLTRLARPDVALITNVGRAHAGPVGGQSAIRRAKLEIAEGLTDGPLLVPGDDAALVAEARARHARVETFGIGEGLDHGVRGIAPLGDGRYRVSVREDLGFELPVPGRPAALCAIAARAALRAAGVADETIVERLATFTAVPGRVSVREHRGVTVIDDAYNANPESVHAALETLAGMHADGRRVAVLGDMLELGELTGPAHREVLAATTGLDVVHLLGDAMLAARTATPEGVRVECHTSRAALVDTLLDDVHPGDVILVKASRGMGLDEVVRALLGEEGD